MEKAIFLRMEYTHMFLCVGGSTQWDGLSFVKVELHRKGTRAQNLACKSSINFTIPVFFKETFDIIFNDILNSLIFFVVIQNQLLLNYIFQLLFY